MRRETLYLILMAGSSEAMPHYSQTCMVAKAVKLLKREAGRETEGMGLKNGKRLLKRRSICLPDEAMRAM